MKLVIWKNFLKNPKNHSVVDTKKEASIGWFGFKNKKFLPFPSTSFISYSLSLGENLTNFIYCKCPATQLVRRLGVLGVVLGDLGSIPSYIGVGGKVSIYFLQPPSVFYKHGKMKKGKTEQYWRPREAGTSFLYKNTLLFLEVFPETILHQQFKGHAFWPAMANIFAWVLCEPTF